MRKMASIKRIAEIKPIPEADKICAYRVDGWWVVDTINKYQLNELVVYCEIDSWIPTTIAPFLSKGREPREYNGVLGECLRTVKLKGQVSQGLLLPLESTCSNIDSRLIEGLDVSIPLNIQKWEAPIPAQLAGEVRGMFPSFISKTDQERIQNLSGDFEVWKGKGYTWEATEKLDGASMTVYYNNGDVGVCSRNLNLKQSEENSLWRVALTTGLIDKLTQYGKNIALQGELIGEGIQKNRYKLKGQKFFLFDVYDIDTGEYLSPFSRMQLVQVLQIDHVPVIMSDMSLEGLFVPSVLGRAEGKSILNNAAEREGLVFKCNQAMLSFKAISNKFLLKTEG